jgi:FtsZ-binding cell division protein ZapB
MREPKSFFLLVGMLILVTISFVLISIWAYHSYFQDQHSTPIAVQSEQAPAPLVKNNNKDSLELILDSILRNSTNQQDSIIDNHSDSLDKVLGLKIVEFKKIKSDIIEILNKKAASKDYGDVDKINLLQQNVNELRERNVELESENEKLKELVKELAASKNQKEETANEKRVFKRRKEKVYTHCYY